MAYARHLQLATIDFLIGDTAPLPKEAANLCMVAAMTADGHHAETMNLLRYVLKEHKDTEQIREIIIQTHLFAGYPRALNALDALRQAAEKDEIKLDALRPAAIEKGMAEADLLKRGKELWDGIYKDNAKRVADNGERLSPDLAYWSQLEGYGRVLSRPGVDALTRELCVVSALMLLDVHPQLKGHIQGAINLGATKEQLWTLLTVVRKLFEANKLFDGVQRVFESVLGKKASDISFEDEQKYRWS
ncbi:MAG: carboxymuconolactone decarboxylase family protein [Planctomycetes bacterium]|nr:carboxymuconolactone decarboxylase family protein [Planctomycetota bacterium]NUQ36155.1 carboxymuconolactone decarboxylase family protein [Planctomycetaceae bacterium]